MDFRCDTWNAGSTCRAGSLKAVAEEISEYKLDLVGVKEVRWGKRRKPLERQRRRQVDNIKMDLREIGWDGLDLPGSG
jgi:hypothetical protein